MDVFDLRDRVIDEYASYVRSFVDVRDPQIRQVVDNALDQGLLWPEPFVGLSPAFEPGAWVEELVAEARDDVILASVHRFKDLDAKAVVIGEVDGGDAAFQQLMYVARSRARSMQVVLESR